MTWAFPADKRDISRHTTELLTLAHTNDPLFTTAVIADPYPYATIAYLTGLALALVENLAEQAGTTAGELIRSGALWTEGQGP